MLATHTEAHSNSDEHGEPDTKSLSSISKNFRVLMCTPSIATKKQVSLTSVDLSFSFTPLFV